MSSLLRTWALPVALLVVASLSGTWYKFVSENVPDPYLDEAFHVPQAQRYCKNDYTWDPKITTPPGLYLVSFLLEPVIGSCDTSSLRALNVGAICIVCLLAYDILRNQRESKASNQPSTSDQGVVQVNEGEEDQQTTSVLFDAHSALNISLFPPLFFFSALYYTDVISTLLVLVSYNVFLKRGKGRWKFWERFTAVQVGIVALSFRQTNIFWVAVFPAGLAVIDTLKEEASKTSSGKRTSSITGTLKESWREGRVHDCSVQDAGLQDYTLLLLSTAVAALRSPLTILKVIIPYLVLLGLFSGFVAWNRGVVLGDKSNHVATIHLPQMLYIWPYIVFFSLPLAVVPLLSPVVRLLPDSQIKSLCQNNLINSSKAQVPQIISTVLFVGLGFAAVHFNTIIHPFTLADNRHYVFYVFRILRRHPGIKYLAVLIYYLSGWMAIQTIGSDRQVKAKGDRDPDKVRQAVDEIDRQPCQISFVFIWLATTTLSVVTAPLVEPRYFILPWLFWRLKVPSFAASSSLDQSTAKTAFDLRLVLETAWLLTINATIAYNFLYRGFTWPNEADRIQRFLW